MAQNLQLIDKGPRLGERGDQGVQNGRALGAYLGAVAVEENGVVKGDEDVAVALADGDGRVCVVLCIRL